MTAFRYYGRAGNIETDQRIYPRPVGITLSAEDSQCVLQVIVSVSISLLEHGDQCIEISHIRLSDFEKADGQQRYQKYCQISNKDADVSDKCKDRTNI